MRKYAVLWMTLAIFVVLLAAYTLGAMRAAQRPEKEISTAAATPSGIASSPKPASDSWQKIIARYNVAAPHAAMAKSGDSSREPTKVALPTDPFGKVIAQLEQRADGGDADAAYALATGFHTCQFLCRRRALPRLANEQKTGRCSS